MIMNGLALTFSHTENCQVTDASSVLEKRMVSIKDSVLQCLLDPIAVQKANMTLKSLSHLYGRRSRESLAPDSGIY